MLGTQEREVIGRLWEQKLEQDRAGLPQAQRHRNLEPASAEFLCALAGGISAKRIVEIGGSTGLSTIALAAAARATGGRVISFEIDPQRQAAAHDTLARLRLIPYVELIPKDATSMLPGMGTVQFALIDCEKEDYIRFFDMLRVEPNGIVVADNILSHALGDYVRHVRSRPRVESMTVTIGAGLEVTRFVAGE